MTIPFVYPSDPHVRRHGPVGYADYGSYRPWLRDEFSFRCVYCLLREQWSRIAGLFDVEHFQAIANRPDLAADYEYLLYACTTCNLAKQAQEIPDPLTFLTSANVKVSEDGRLQTDNADAACLIEILGLDSEEAVEFRMTWIGIIAMAASGDPDLHRKLMRFPNDLPDLQRLQPPGGNTRPEGILASFHARRQRGELPEIY
jgi:hypothetical protein